MLSAVDQDRGGNTGRQAQGGIGGTLPLTYLTLSQSLASACLHESLTRRARMLVVLFFSFSRALPPPVPFEVFITVCPGVMRRSSSGGAVSATQRRPRATRTNRMHERFPATSACRRADPSPPRDSALGLEAKESCIVTKRDLGLEAWPPRLAGCPLFRCCSRTRLMRARSTGVGVLLPFRRGARGWRMQ